jgi:hypothetical protein
MPNPTKGNRCLAVSPSLNQQSLGSSTYHTARASGPCQAPAVEGGLCFCHAHPERLAELDRPGGQKDRHWKDDTCRLPHRPLKSNAEVSELLEETVNRVRHKPLFDLRAVNAIGFLAGVLLKVLDQRWKQ